MNDNSFSLAERLVLQLKRPDGADNLRPVHAVGIGAEGRFVPSPVARDYCMAAPFADPNSEIKVTVRFSNGTGCAHVHDGWSDVRGMATRFWLDHVTPGQHYDLVAMTLPCFFSKTPEQFADFAKEAFPKPYRRERPWDKIRDMLHLRQPFRNPYPGETISPDVGAMTYASANNVALPGVFGAAMIGAPVSYVRAAYHAVHTFVVTNAAGERRWVRFHWQPVLGVLNTPQDQTPVDDYLKAELLKRLQKKDEPRFTLSMTIGETGDELDNPARPWPPHRIRVTMGTLTLYQPLPDTTTEALGFNPCAMVPGIGLSDDKVLHIREEAYRFSARLRGHPWPGDREGGDV